MSEVIIMLCFSERGMEAEDLQGMTTKEKTDMLVGYLYDIL